MEAAFASERPNPVSGGKSVIRHSLGKLLLDNLLHVVKWTNTPLFP